MGGYSGIWDRALLHDTQDFNPDGQSRWMPLCIRAHQSDGHSPVLLFKRTAAPNYRWLRFPSEAVHLRTRKALLVTSKTANRLAQDALAVDMYPTPRLAVIHDIHCERPPCLFLHFERILNDPARKAIVVAWVADRKGVNGGLALICAWAG